MREGDSRAGDRLLLLFDNDVASVALESVDLAIGDCVTGSEKAGGQGRECKDEG